MKTFFFILLALQLTWQTTQAQAPANPTESMETDAFQIKEFYTKSLTQSSAYRWLWHLCKDIGARVSGSPKYIGAVEWARQTLDSLGVDTVYLQPVKVPHWERGTIESAKIINSTTLGTHTLTVAALGFSAPTPNLGITAEIVQVTSLEQLEKLGTAGVKGKIVFFNIAMDPAYGNTGHAYGKAGSFRSNGPNAAAKLGAVGALTRSLSLKIDDVPHSGNTKFEPSVQPIPAAALSNISANLLEELLKKETKININLQLNCQRHKDVLAYNVIGELKGSTHPNEIIVFGGHLDSWDIGEGAHDDGAGCVHAIGVLEQMKLNQYKPKRTLRCVLFANEENGLNGGKKYAEEAKKSKNKHIVAIESDLGGHTPQGFNYEGTDEVCLRNMKTLAQWRNILTPLGAYLMEKGGSGADISYLREQGVLLLGLHPDNQRYFDYHHSKNDIFENVHKRELELGVAAMTSIVYLFDMHGVK